MDAEGVRYGAYDGYEGRRTRDGNHEWVGGGEVTVVAQSLDRNLFTVDWELHCAMQKERAAELHSEAME
jgi:hypothetical protein